ncbi:hypothetical protein FPV13_13725 (plasmid) [Mammaliicoccus sciuri]|nr:hypothetical protein FPV13_13725 [Mammaliicoccus sciuri]
MRYSLFRLRDIIEVCVIYLICFTSNSIFTFVNSLNLGNSSILNSFLKNIIDYQIIINIFLTFIVVVFHYQFVNKKRIEIYCRILVGDNLIKITLRYIKHSFYILIFSFLLSLISNYILELDIDTNLYLFFIFIIYILLSAGQVLKK